MARGSLPILSAAGIPNVIETPAEPEIDSNVVVDDERVDLMASYAFVFMHVAAVASLFAGFSWVAVGACVATFWVRMFGITAGYH